MQSRLETILEEYSFQPIGEQNPKIKQLKGIAGNSKPNPQKLFIAEGIWILGLCEKFQTPIDCLILCPEHIFPNAASRTGSLHWQSSLPTIFPPFIRAKTPCCSYWTAWKFRATSGPCYAWRTERDWTAYFYATESAAHPPQTHQGKPRRHFIRTAV